MSPVRDNYAMISSRYFVLSSKTQFAIQAADLRSFQNELSLTG